MKKITAKLLLVLFLTAQFYGIVFLFPKKLDSANLTSVSDTLSNNRLSFRGELDAGVAAGSGVIVLETTPAEMLTENTSTGSAALMGNESVKVGNNAPIAIKTIDTASRIVLASGLINAASTSDPVVATVSAVHTVTFTPVSTVPNGAFRVLLPVGSTGGNDGLPDKDGFDFNSIDNADVSCLGGGSGYTWSASYDTASASAITVGATIYHSFECRYTGNGGSGTAITMYIGAPAQTDNLINPSPSVATGRTPGPGGAETYTFRVKHTYGTAQSYSDIDESLGTIGVVEAVRVTATVAPTLTFQISGRSGTSCNQSASATSTYNTVPFGTLTATALTNNMAQQLVVSTNAAAGYVVTASESAALTAFNVTGTPTIIDTTCGGSCTTTTAADWNSTSQTGFGYSLQDVAGDCVSSSLEWNNGGATFNARPFGTVGQSIMSSDVPADSDIAYVCYRIIVAGSQTAGDYENYAIYIATATF